MSKSIISNEKECFVCGSYQNLHKHHIFYGHANRRISEKYGCWVYLCDIHHNMSSDGVHFNKPFDTTLKKYCQEKWQEINGNKDQFIETFGRSYL